MQSPEVNPVLTLHGWPSKHLGGTRLPRMLLLSVMVCAFMVPMLQRVMAAHLAIHLPYTVTLGIVLLAWCPLIWKGRWPLVSKDALGTWRLHLSTKGFASGMGDGQPDWHPWTPAVRVSFRRVRPDFCRVQISQERIPGGPAGVDLVVACDDQKVDEVAAYIRACREGRAIETPVVESASLAARLAAGQARSSGSAGPDDASSLEHCPECTYDLAGLPGKGQCPECGFEYDAQSLIVLYGRNAATPGYMPASKVAGFVVFFLLMMLMNLGGDYLVRRFAVPAWTRGFVVGGVMAGFFALLGWRSSTSRRPRRISFFTNSQRVAGQVRLSPAGFGIRLSHGVCPMQPWSDRMHMRMVRMGGSTYRLQISNSPGKVRFRDYVWARLDFDSDEQTVKRISERVTQWREAAAAEKM